MAHVILWNCAPVESNDQHDETWQLARPLGPHQIASWLRQQGYTVKVIDFCNVMTTAELVQISQRHIDHRTLCIGVSSTFWVYSRPTQLNPRLAEPSWVIAARQELEHLHPELTWCLGGAKAGADFAYVWHTFKGDSEDAVLQWLDHLSQRRSITRARFDIRTSCHAFESDDHISPYEVLPIELGRGCMFSCKFCGFSGIGKKAGTYLRDKNMLKKEILDHHDRWGTTRFYYVDDTVNENADKLQDLVDIARSVPFRLEWIGYARADLISAHPHTEQMLFDSGARSLFFGIESFEERSSQIIGKGWSGRHAKKWLLEKREKWQYDLSFSLGMIVGLPGQDPDSLHADNQWLIDHEMHNWNWTGLIIDRSNFTSEFSRNSEKYGFVFPDKLRPWYWENNNWNYDKAFDIAQQLSIKKKVKPAGFYLGNLASVGFEFEPLMQNFLNSDLRREILSRKTAMLQDYVRKSLA